jgi:hypothetical protein
VRELWLRNHESVLQGLIAQYGATNHEQKLKNFLDVGAEPMSVVAFHNTFFRQARDAFVIGAYYPSLTAVCALAERVLNHLILALREDFRQTPEYKRVFRKDSFDNWNLAIETLAAWEILMPRTVVLLRDLKTVRDRSLHFCPDIEPDCREAALNALRLLHDIVKEQFGAVGDRPWYIQGNVGIAFVRKSQEEVPFVARVILPSCALVGPAHEVRWDKNSGGWVAVDAAAYPDREVTDDEFIELLKVEQEVRAEARREVSLRVRSEAER